MVGARRPDPNPNPDPKQTEPGMLIVYPAENRIVLPPEVGREMAYHAIQVSVSRWRWTRRRFGSQWRASRIKISPLHDDARASRADASRATLRVT